MINNIFAIDIDIEQLQDSVFLTLKRARQTVTGKKEALQVLDDLYKEIKEFIINKLDESNDT